MRLASSRLRVLASLLLLAACGGGGSGGNVAPNPPPPPPPPPAPPPAPVATVAVTPPTSTLVPSQTVTLTAEVKDASGNVLTGRTITWSSSTNTIATVSPAGLVTAVAAGNATITATSEGKSSTATILVADGAVVGTTGGTVTAAGGAVKIDVPAGAAPAGTIFAVEQVSQPAPAPSDAEPFGGTFYKFSPEGAHFSTPVTVTMRYDPSALAWAIPEDLTLLRWDGTSWSKLTNIVVDQVAHTISGQTSGFSTITPARSYFSVSLSPNPAQVNVQQRSVTLTVKTPSPNRNLALYTIQWTTTGANGTVNTQQGTSIQYTETAANLPTGTIDRVTVKILPPAFTGLTTVLSSSTINIDADLKWIVGINPPGAQIKFGRIIPFDATVKDVSGVAYPTPANLHYVWQNTAVSGTWSVANGITNAVTNTYTAFDGRQAAAFPPRGERITVDVLEDQITWDFTGPTPVRNQTIKSLGKVDQFIEIGNNQYVGTFAIRQVATPNGACVYADVLIPKVIPASKYVVFLRGFTDPLGMYTAPFIFQFSGATGTGIGKVEDVITNWRYPLDGSCVGTAGIQGRIDIFNTRFRGMYIEIEVTP